MTESPKNEPQMSEPVSSAKTSKITTLIVSIPAMASLVFIIYMAIHPWLQDSDTGRVFRENLDLDALRQWAGECLEAGHDGVLPAELWPQQVAAGTVKQAKVRRLPEPPLVFIEVASDVVPYAWLGIDPGDTLEHEKWHKVVEGVWRVPGGPR